MALPSDFSKIYGSTATGGLTPISDVSYAKGWEFVGSNPPTKNDFSYLQNLSDLKSQWLYSNKLQRTDPFGDIKSDGEAAISTALTNLGLGAAAKIDVATNAEVITGTVNKAVTAASLKNRFDAVVLYPNGTQASPPTLTANQRIVIDNPFPGRPVAAQVEVFANNIWAAPYFMSTPQGNAGPTAGATPSYLYETDKIVIQTGVDGVLYKSTISGSAHNFTTGGDVFSGTIYSSRTYRLRVRAI